MRMAVLALIAVGALASLTTLPAADSPPAAVAATTPAEARLIDRLRAMAQPPDTVPEPLRTRAEVAMVVTDAPVAPQPAEKLVVVPPELNIRSEPNREAAILGRLSHGATIDVAERTDGWVRVSGGGIDGWASAQFLATAH